MSIPSYRQLEIEIENMNRRLQVATSQSDVWFWETDTTHRFVYFSDNLTQLSGMTKQDLIGTSRLDIAINSNEDHFKQHIRDITNHRPFSEFRYARENHDGKLRNLVVTGEPFFDADGKFAGYHGTAYDETDILNEQTAQRNREQYLVSEVKKQRNDLNTVLENLSQSLMWYDRDGIILLNNRKTIELLGFDKKQYAKVFTLKDHLQMMATRGDFGVVDIDLEVSKRLERLLNQQTATSYPVYIPSVGRHLLVTVNRLDDGSHILTHTDITDEKHARIQSSERQVLLDALLDTIDYGIMVLNKDAKVELVNKAFCNLMSINPKFFDAKPTMKMVFERMYENKCTGYLGGDERGWIEYRDSVMKHIMEGDDPAAERVRQDGKTILHSCIALPDGKRLLTYFDVTKMKDMEKALLMANEELEDRIAERTQDLRNAQASLVKRERQALLGDLVSSLCHELRNPLNALKTSLFVVRKKIKGDYPNLEKTFERSERTIDRCSNILTDLYDFALTPDLNRVPIRLDRWVRQQADMVEVPENVEVTFKIDDNMPEVFADEVQLSRSFQKILKNAVYAVCEVEHERQPEIIIEVLNVADRMEIMIVDNGIGMREDVNERAFEPLFSTRGFGVGLGLPIALQTLKRHGGGVDLISNEGVGTMVTLWLPTMDSENRKAA